MKKTLIILAILATAAAPLTLRADSPESTAKKHRVRKTVTVTTMPKVFRKDVEYVYISKRKVTGSNIPMVIRVYNNRVESTASAEVLSTVDIASTGSEDLAGALVRRDPALSYRR